MSLFGTELHFSASKKSRFDVIAGKLFTVFALLRRAGGALLVALLCLLVWRIAEQVKSVSGSAQAFSASAQKTLADLDKEIPQLQASVQSAAASVHGTSAQVNGLVGEIRTEVPGIAGQVNVDLQETHRLILESGLTAMEARKASAEERAALPQMTASAKQSLDALHGELAELQTTTRDLDTLINDPANRKTLDSLSQGTAALAATAQDGQQFVHKLLHPTWPHRIWNGALAVAHALNPL